MAGIRWPLVARRIHKWLALLVGLQVVLWTITGFYMVAVHIDIIHGDHLVRAAAPATYKLADLSPPAALLAEHPGAREIRLQRLLDRPVWRVDTAQEAILHDAASGQRLPPLSPEEVKRIARAIYAGSANIVSTRLLTTAPLEMQTRKPPFWQVEFAGWNRPTLYISATTGELLARRHLLWRIFDFAWMMHIMDYEERSDVNNPLLRIATWSAVAMAVSGAWLLLWSFPKGRRKRVA
ncbi:PepSY domain-containing protein [Sphingomonas lenta]|uniref:Peptidase n=1 Tax=Sphingomonas lenta TaxID=1141887 RepID=A0A2A2SB55_9SPHN|nr:PepSY domain-containing protein [Sphingomonas lenta]PAX06477.1 hypothetical protein CKY28_17130 [Sphingomonas lenta]